MKTEYLIPIDSKQGVATSTSAFNNLLMSNDNISISNNTITYKSDIFNYTLQPNLISETSYICYHLTIEYTSDNLDLSSTTLKSYQELLRCIKSIFTKYTKDFEILWDDISFILSQKAYPLIYEIENLMRKLLTKFMLINVGAKWEKENIPSKISKSKNKEKDINLGNGLLYQLDFIELSTFLFDPYSIKTNIADLKQKIDSKESIPSSLLENYIPHSNWERYFNSIVAVENEHLKKKWQELYDLRCKIAHNNLFTSSDYKKVQDIVADLKPSIEKAISELDSITVTDDDKQIISENFVKTSNEQIGSFIIAFNELSNSIIEYLTSNNFLSSDKSDMPYTIAHLSRILKEAHIINDKVYKTLQLLSYKRDKIVHGTYLINEADLDDSIKEIQSLIVFFKNYKKVERPNN